MYCDKASTDVVIAIRYRYILDVYKYQGNVREEENNDQPVKGCSLFINNLTIKEVFLRLLTPLSNSLHTKTQGYVPCGTVTRV